MNGYGNSVFLRTAWEVSSGVAPVNTVAPVISGTQVVGSTLTSTTGTWTGIPAPTFTYQWFRGATLIGGATSITYVLVQADAGNTSNITCKVTGTNGLGNATATSNTLAQIFDFDANAFITSAVITDNTQKAATNSLTIDLKGYNVWTKFSALYPFVGGTATTHKYNLKNPLDTNAAFRLVFHGGWTHSSTGALPNGTNAYANTFLNPSTRLTLNNTHISYYSRTNSDTGQYGWEFGCATGDIAIPCFAMRARSLNFFRPDLYNYQVSTQISNTDSRKHFIANRTSSTVLNGWMNGVKGGTSTYTNTDLSPNEVLFMAAFNFKSTVSQFSNRQCAFASIGDGLTDTEAANFYTAVQAFQTTLGRNV